MIAITNKQNRTEQTSIIYFILKLIIFTHTAKKKIHGICLLFVQGEENKTRCESCWSTPPPPPKHQWAAKVFSTCSTCQHLVQGHHPLSAPTATVIPCHAMSFVYKYLSAASKLLVRQEGGGGKQLRLSNAPIWRCATSQPRLPVSRPSCAVHARKKEMGQKGITSYNCKGAPN